MKRPALRRFFPIGRVALYVGCGFISAFILVSSYESIYNRALPFVHTLAKVNLSTLSASYDLPAAAALKPSVYGQFGKPSTLTIPNRQSSLRLSIVAPISENGTWLARASTMHLLIPTPPLNGNISTAILYCRASFRTVSAGALPVVGSNLFIDTDQNWRYVYKVTLAKTFADSYPYTPINDGAKGKLIVFCNDAAHQANDIIEADIISVQGTTQ